MLHSLPLQVERAKNRADDLLKKSQENAKDEETVIETPDSDALPPNTVEALQAKMADIQKKLDESEHRYKVLQGKYNAEIKALGDDPQLVARLKSDVANLKAQIVQLRTAGPDQDTATLISDLRKEIDRLKAEAKPKESDSASTINVLDPKKVLSQEEIDHLDREDLGGQTLNIINKLIHAVAGAGAKPSSQVEDRLGKIEQSVAEVGKKVTQTSQKTFQQMLWEIPNASKYFDAGDGKGCDTDWAAWLDAGFDQRRARLQKAIAEQDIETVKAGIAEFERTMAARTEPKPKPKPKSALEKRVEPSESGGEIQPPLKAGEGQEYTMAQAKQFYIDYAKGRYRGREKEAAAIDADIVKATQEGRLTA